MWAVQNGLRVENLFPEKEEMNYGLGPFVHAIYLLRRPDDLFAMTTCHTLSTSSRAAPPV